MLMLALVTMSLQCSASCLNLLPPTPAAPPCHHSDSTDAHHAGSCGHQVMVAIADHAAPGMIDLAAAAPVTQFAPLLRSAISSSLAIIFPPDLVIASSTILRV
jgi:hypothetical protein